MERRSFLRPCLFLGFQEFPAFRAAVSLVHVDCEVTDGTRTLTGLGKRDFQVCDNGQPQELESVSQDLEPLDLVLLFDVSNSMRPAVKQVAEGARSAFQHLKAGDRVLVAKFSGNARVVRPFTADLARVENAIRRRVLGEKFGGGTFLIDALDDMSFQLADLERSRRRRALLVITDNQGGRSGISDHAVITHFWEADASVSGLIVKHRMDKAEVIGWMIGPHGMVLHKALERHIDKLADATGGALVPAEDPGSSFAELIERIRRRYSIYYRLPVGTPGETRLVRAGLTTEARSKWKDARVRARKGYTYPEDPSASPRSRDLLDWKK